jgi:hypothetical protein
LEEMVRALRDVTRAEAVAVINRDGSIVAAALPPSVSPETFSIMCAAILGAGMTAAGALSTGHSAMAIANSLGVAASRSSTAPSINVCVPPPDAPVQASRFRSTSGSDSRKSSARMLFQVWSPIRLMFQSRLTSFVANWRCRK